VAWILRLMQTGAGGEDPGTDLMETSRPDGLGDIANLGLTLSEAKQLLANVQREIAAAQARDHVVRRPDCPRCDGVCHVKDYRDHVVATLFGHVTMKLPRFRCARCGGNETGIGWPSHCRSTPELDRLRARLSALMTYRVAADLLEQMFPIDAGTDPETLRRHTLRVGEAFADRAAIRPETSARRSRPPWIPPSSGVVRTGSVIWRCGLATSKRNPGHHKFSVPSRKPIRTSRY
jgi:hypothetical protein